MAELALGGLLLLALGLVWRYNQLVRARTRAQAAWAGIDIQIKRRGNLVPNLAPAVGQPAGHERELIDELADLEEKIAYARHFYNRNVAEFNTRIASVPDLVIARLFGLEPLTFYEADADGRILPELTFDSPPTGPAEAKWRRWRRADRPRD